MPNRRRFRATHPDVHNRRFIDCKDYGCSRNPWVTVSPDTDHVLQRVGRRQRLGPGDYAVIGTPNRRYGHLSPLLVEPIPAVHREVGTSE